jgi:hypothetical protein
MDVNDFEMIIVTYLKESVQKDRTELGVFCSGRLECKSVERYCNLLSS